MTIPNALTLFRIALIPLFWILAVSSVPAMRWCALIIFIIATFTDFLDGKIARKTGKITSFGKIMDPLADKLLVISALVIFITQGRISGIPVMLIIARELAVTSLRVVAIENGKVMAADKSGKWKAAAQLSYVILMLLHIANYSFIPYPYIIENIAIWLTVVITLWSGVDYFYKNIKIIKSSAG